jgi:hypothetical protein
MSECIDLNGKRSNIASLAKEKSELFRTVNELYTPTIAPEVPNKK